VILFKLLFLAISGFLVILIAAGGIGLLLILTGEPGICDSPVRVGRDLDPPPSDALADELEARWDEFSADIRNQQAVFQASESEVTSRARRYAEEEDIPIEDLFIYYCGDGKGQIAGRIDVAGLGTSFVATGTLVVGGEKPVVELDSVHVGKLPGFVADVILDLLLDDDSRTLELDENLLGFEISGGLAELIGGPD
jgi:hypothetical protein